MDLDEMYSDKAEQFLAAINKQADEEIACMTTEIRAKKSEAGKIKAEHALAEALAKIRAEKSSNEMKFKKELSRCEFETTKAVRAYRKEKIDRFFEELAEELKKFTDTDKYDDYLTSSLEKAGGELGTKFTVLVREKDVERIKKLTSNPVRVERSIMLGGVSAVDEERGLYADYTFDSALQNEREAFSEKTELRF